MKVIFVKDLKKTAKKGDIKEVKDGYAENYLIKNGYAVAYNDKNVRVIEKEKKEEQEKDDINRKDAIALKNKLEKEKIRFKVKVGEQDKVFGSISIKQIREELNKMGYKIDKNNITLTSSLQSIGYHNVEINIYKEIKAIIKVELYK